MFVLCFNNKDTDSEKKQKKEKSSEVSIKTRSTPASFSIQARTLSTQL